METPKYQTFNHHVVPAVFLLSLTILCACRKDPVTPGPDVDKPETEVEDPAKPWGEEGMPDATYICNGEVQIGIDLTRGGGICHFSEKGTKRNLLNRYDTGRFIQQSYYGDADGSNWNGTAWNWNPVQGGSWKGEPSEIVSKQITKTSIRIVTRPRHWATGELLETCEMTEDIKLVNQCAKVVFTFNYTGTKSYKARHQEMPAVFTDGALGTLVCYTGSKPWTGDELKRITPGNLSDGATNQYLTRKEEWSAYVDAKDWGIGVYTPGTTQITYYTFGHGATGAGASPCSYFSPIRTLAITPGLTLRYEIWITAGSTAAIRKTFYDIQSGKY